MPTDAMQERFDETLAKAQDVLFLCSGNILRSAFAELYARHLGFPLAARSAATTYVNERIHPATAAALAERGVDAGTIRSFRPTTLRDAGRAIGPRTLVLAMTGEHLRALAALGPRAPQGFLLSRAAARDEEVPDPMFTGAFDQAFARIAELVEALVARRSA